MLRVNLHLCSCLNIDHDASEADWGSGEELGMCLKTFHVSPPKLHYSLKPLNTAMILTCPFSSEGSIKQLLINKSVKTSMMLARGLLHLS